MSRNTHSSSHHQRHHRSHRTNGVSHRHRSEVDAVERQQREIESYSSQLHRNQRIPIDSADYDPLDDILEMFETPHSLSELDQLLSYTNAYKLQLEDEVEKKDYIYNQFIQENSTSGNGIDTIDEELAAMINSYQETKALSMSTGTVINSMTANIKQLDQCKKNLTLSMTILKRLQMLASAYDQLNTFISDQQSSNKDYEGIMNLLSVVTDLMQHFQTYKSIDDINTLNKRISSLKNKIVSLIFEDFEKEIQGSINNPKLSRACEILDMLGKPYHDRLVNWYLNAQLQEVTSIFKSTEEAGSLDNLKRRFIFFQRIITNFETNDVNLFPKSWKMSLRIAQKFCEVTKADLKEVTTNETRLSGSKVDVNLLLNSLSETLEFEAYLNQKFKYYDDYDERQQKEGQSYNFDKSISDIFEPYLNIWIDYQGVKINEKFIDFMNPATMLKRSGVDDTNSNDTSSVNNTSKKSVANESSLNVLESAAELFRLYRQTLNQLSKLSQGEPLVRLAQIFVRYLLQYKVKILESILPDTKRLASSTMEDNKEALEYICLILNTADYCSLTVTQLENRMISLIKPAELADKMDFDTVREKYLELVNSCLSLLFFKIEKDLSFAWRELSNINSRSLKEVTGESRYVNTIRDILEQNCETIFTNFTRTLYVRSFVDRLLELVLNELVINYCKLKPITEIMSEQFLLDIQTLQKVFLKLPDKSPEEKVASKPISKSVGFIRLVNGKFGNMESLLKIIMIPIKPTNNFIQNYFILIGDSNFSNFTKVLQLKGLLSNENKDKDKFKYMDYFKRELRIYKENINPNNSGKPSDDDGTDSVNSTIMKSDERDGSANLDDEINELSEANEFLESIKLNHLSSSHTTFNGSNTLPLPHETSTSSLSLSPGSFGSPSTPVVLQNIFSNSGGPKISPQINNFFNNLNSDNNNNHSINNNHTSSNDDSPSNFKIDKQALLNTKDQIEKNFTTFINSENKMNINENIKNIGKFFKKN